MSENDQKLEEKKGKIFLETEMRGTQKRREEY